MTKGKYARKRQHAKERREQIVAVEHAAEEKAVVVQNSSARVRDSRWWVRFGQYVVEKSSFTDWCIAAFTFVLAGVAIYQYQVMGGQLAVMRNDERAWLELKTLPADGRVPKVEVIAGKPVYFPIKIVNTGKTPAKQVVLALRVEVTNSSKEVSFDCVEKSACPAHVEIWGMLSPGDFNEPLATRFLQSGDQWLATDVEDSEWKEEQAYVAVYGMVQYLDVYNTHHWTKFCYWMNDADHAAGKKTVFSAAKCTAYNAVDNN